MAKKTLISYSGGMDSSILLYQLVQAGDEVHALHFSYGARQNAREHAAAASICRDLGVPYRDIPLPFVGELFSSALLRGGRPLPRLADDKPSLSQTVVPGRNGIFLSILAGYAESIGAARIALVNHAGDHFVYPDCRPEWIAAISLTVFLGSEGKVSVYAPLTHCTKDELCRRGERLGVPFARTWSCYDEQAEHCGTCSACRLRQKAFAESGLSDPTVYLAC